MDAIFRDFRDAARQWARTPIVTAAVLVSLALGIGANTAIFSLIDSLLLRSLPVSRPEQLVRLQEDTFNFHSLPLFRQLTGDQGPIDGLAAVTLMLPDISPTPERRSALGLAVSGSFFNLLGVRPAMGRLIAEDDDRLGRPANVAVLEYEFWQHQYAGRGDAIGRTVPIDGHPFTIIGVVQRGFFGLMVGRRFDVAIPLEGFRTIEPGFDDADENSLTVFARLDDGGRRGDAESALRAQQAAIRGSLALAPGSTRLTKPWTLVPMAMGLSTPARSRYARPLTLLMAIVGLVLLIACANVANLLLSRAETQRGELAVRFSLGASRWQVLRALAIESLALSLAGAAGGALIGIWTARAIVEAITVNQIGAFTTWISAPLDLRILAFTSAVGVATSLVFGMGPAFWASRVDPLEATRERSRTVVSGSSRFGPVHAIVAAQVALAFVLVLGGGLLVRSFVAISTQDLGFNRDNVLVAHPDFNHSTVAREQRREALAQIRDDLAALPGIDGVGFSEGTPFGLGSATVPVALAGEPAQGNEARIPLNRISNGYLQTLGITVTSGRDFQHSDRESPRVAIVNEAFVQRFFRGESAIGRSLQVLSRRPQAVEIVGVVADLRSASLREPVSPELYLPITRETDAGWNELSIRTNTNSPAMRAAVLEAVSRVAPGASVEFRVLGDGLTYASAQERVMAWLSASFAALALLLSAIGLYGVMTSFVVRRRHEMGVRIAVGAPPSRVLGMVLKQAGAVVFAGLVLGLVLALGAGRLVSSLLFGVTASDPLMMAAAALVLASVALIAGYIPARRASRTDPMAALREE